MKILQVHNRYKITGGEWTVLNQEFDLLSRKHTVEQLIVDNSEELDSLFHKLKLIFTTHYNRSSKEQVKKKLQHSDADIMHVHNFFPILSPSVFDASREAGVPSVFTLHNYRLMHPNGYLLHNGGIDERSIRGSAYSCVWDGVYRNSVLQTAVVAHMIEYHRKKGTWNEKVDCFLCLSEFARSKFIEAGLPGHKLRIKPNFVKDFLEGKDSENIIRKKDPYYLFIGRISEEKGVRTLVSAWDKMKGKPGGKRKLVMIGDGPMRKEIQKKYGSNHQIEWRGFLDRKEVRKYLMKAKALVFPSEWYEGMPMTILEAFSAGTPVITSNIGSQAELVEHNRTGLHFDVGSEDSLIAAVEAFEENRDQPLYLGTEARKEYEQKYTPEVNYSKLMSIYEELTESPPVK